MEKQFLIDKKFFTLYQSASNDWCVKVEVYGEEPEYYNKGTLENAYDFILSYAEIPAEDSDEAE